MDIAKPMTGMAHVVAPKPADETAPADEVNKKEPAKKAAPVKSADPVDRFYELGFQKREQLEAALARYEEAHAAFEKEERELYRAREACKAEGERLMKIKVDLRAVLTEQQKSEQTVD